MQIDGPIVRAKDLDRVVLWVNEPLRNLGHTLVAKYIRWGSKQTFPSKKSKTVPVPQRSTCASRPIWYDLTNKTNGVAFWPMTQKYRHIVAANQDQLLCNHRLFYVRPKNLSDDEAQVLVAILNSTVIALIKHFYGRYAGSEGTLDTEVIDCLLLDVPDPRCGDKILQKRILESFKKMSARSVTHLVEDSLLKCTTQQGLREILNLPSELPKELLQEDRRNLDTCVLELIGVNEENKRQKIIKDLYTQTTNYYRFLRTQEIQAMENRSGKTSQRLGPQDIAESLWLGLSETERGLPIVDWIKSTYKKTEIVSIPDGKPEALGASDMFNPDRVIFKNQKETQQINYRHAEQAELVVELANVDIRENLALPKSETECTDCLDQLRNRLNSAKQQFSDLAASRTGTQSLQEKTADLLLHWFTHGKGG